MGRRRREKTLQNFVASRIKSAAQRDHVASLRWLTAQFAATSVLEGLTQRLDGITDMDNRQMVIQVPSSGKRITKGTISREGCEVHIDLDKDGNVLGVVIDF